MTYAGSQLIHDADAHTMEMPDFLDDFIEQKFAATVQAAGLFDRSSQNWDDMQRLLKQPDDPAYRAQNEEKLMLRKNRDALGSFRKEDRTEALDLMGFGSQLMFTTALLRYSMTVEHGDDMDLAYAVGRAHCRYMTDFCSVDPRLLAVGYLPLADFERSKAFAKEAIDMGCKALMIPSRCPNGHSHSHIALDPVWATIEEAGIPVVLHVGNGGQLLDPNFFNNGLPPVKDFHGGDANFKSIDYMAIFVPPMQAMTALIIDGVLDRFPNLKFGVIEDGASWVPGWMRNMDSAHQAFYKNEERLQKMSMKPSDFVKRQVRVTPYPHEDTGWVIQNTSDEICLFSSDYPHVEGGRNPIKRFETSMDNAGISDAARTRFYSENFIDLMGAGLAPELRYPKLAA